MRLTTKGRFAVTAMIDLALREHAGPVSLAGISGRQAISLSYLEQLFAKLRRRELVGSVRGPGGGYQLARKMVDISVADILAAVDERIDSTQCSGKENCLDDHRCLTHDLWNDLNHHMAEYMNSVTLHDLVARQKMRLRQHQEHGHVGILRDHRRDFRPGNTALAGAPSAANGN